MSVDSKRTIRAKGWRLGLATALTLATVIVLSAPAVAWSGKEVTKEGVIHVMNPEKSAKKSVEIDLDEQWRIGGEDDEEIFGVITDVIADAKGNFYMLDSQLNEIKVYSKDGEYLRTIGREGEGPGEFRGAFNMFLVPGGNIGVLQAFPGKVVTLTPDGDPADEYKIPDPEDGAFRVLFSAQHAGDNLALVYGLNKPAEGGFTQTSVLSLMAADGETEHRLMSQDASLQAASPKMAEVEWDTFRNGRWTAAADGRAFACSTYGEYSINVWDAKGNLERVIHREYPVHKRSEEDVQRILDLYKGFTKRIPIPDMKFEIEDVYNQIQAIHARDDGSLWVQSSRGANDLPDGVVGIFDVFDKKGHFVRQVTLKGEGNAREDGYFFVKDRLFVVTDFLNAMMALQGGGGDSEDAEEEPELMQIISYKIDAATLGG